jgi:hypothetical protein
MSQCFEKDRFPYLRGRGITNPKRAAPTMADFCHGCKGALSIILLMDSMEGGQLALWLIAAMVTRGINDYSIFN